jgi:peroxiredoxin
MTQLVQLQQVAHELEANGYSLCAISNDPAEILSEFAEKRGITYSLLSDPESQVIRSFGIMNQLIEESEGRSMNWHGIAYPGTYFLNPDGTVHDKDFHRHHARRSSGATVLARALGRDVELSPDNSADATDGGLALRVGLSDPSLRLEMISTLAVDIQIPTGLHAYAQRAPEQFTPLTVDVKAPGLRIGEVRWPTEDSPCREQLRMPELGLTVPALSRTVRLELPITATSEAVRLDHEITDNSVGIDVTLAAQLCDEHACRLPQQLTVRLNATLERLIEPAGIQHYVDRVEKIEQELGRPVI